eukprot:GFUD01053892.1.p1 GENE.GFUD01053892.1~~GFUD01053892.1.p1  ORF type:complete len:252 (+),score=52.29 GFUD01053892.1:369-1124(+)
MLREFWRGGSLVISIVLISGTNLASCETDPKALKPVEDLEELSIAIDEEFSPVTVTTFPTLLPLPTTVKPSCVRAPEAGILFTSDNFPGKYLKDTNCTYTMTAKEGSRVQLTFFVFDTEANPRCSYDVATVFDSNGTIIHKYCGKNTKNLQVISSEEDLSFNFKTDSVQESMGFLASWREVLDVKEEQDTEGKYLISFPSSFIEESPENICIELFDSDKSDGIIETQVYITDEEEKNNWVFGDSPFEKKKY